MLILQFTSIVGANGSGKSNILDAFVFALGELSGKTMRVNNIKDLICNGGTDGGIPSKWARVDVIFDNTDRRIPLNEDTIKISRKINIKGQGKYYLNDKATTRRELQDMMDLAGLVPNSSNLILQGELFRIINRVPLNFSEYLLCNKELMSFLFKIKKSLLIDIINAFQVWRYKLSQKQVKKKIKKKAYQQSNN